jgi:general nucleoside transport system permease protein
MDSNLLSSLAGVIALAVPIIFASIGETLTERSGVINLSVNGTLMLTAMAGFVVAVETQSIFLAFAVSALIGAFVALIIAFASITLKQNQVAVGFVLTMMCRDLSYFLGNPYMGKPGPRVPSLPIPLLKDIPVIGPLLFNQDILVYTSFMLIILAYLWVFKTRPGLMLQGIGERPAASFTRGANVNRMRYLYTIVGGALVGLAGPVYSLSAKAGWAGPNSGLDGLGWIALAITIFGGWNPLRAAAGAYLFAFLQWLGIFLQPQLPNIPSQVLQVAPFPLMILALLLVNVGNAEWVDRTLAGLPESARKVIAKLLRALRTTPPASLGVPFENE